MEFEATGSRIKDHPLEEGAWELVLRQESKEQEAESIKSNEINWIGGGFWDSWDKVKGHWHKIVIPNSETFFDINESPKIDKWFFLAHDNDEIEGKPQLIHDVMQKIPLIRLTSKINVEGFGKNKTEYKTPKYIFFDERYDKRYDGAMIDTFSKDFWIYKVKHNGKEYKVFSENKLHDGKCKIKGMTIDIADVSEMSKTLKVNSLSHIFIAKESESAIKTFPKKELVDFVKDKNISFSDFMNHLATHPFGTINSFPIEAELLRASALLSGKVDGWPQHLAIMGPQGSRKTMGHGETIYSKFDEDVKFASATSYRLKGLIPSFKKVPAEPGYILQCHRIAIIDEIGKLIDAESQRHDKLANNIMGEFNDILEHKQRSGGSGNDFIDIDPTAKVWLITNPCSDKPTIYHHVGLIDPTTMSRIFWWVQDSEELELVLGPEGLLRNPPTPSQDPESSPETYSSILKECCYKEKRKKSIVLGKFRGKVLDKEVFLSIYDSCNAFLSEVDDDRVQGLADMISGLAREPMKSVWRPRSFHHVKLLVDGLCKLRCLFESRDFSFQAKDIDYDWAERILVRMVKSWDTDLSPKEDFA